MAKDGDAQGFSGGDRFLSDVNTRIRDLEEKQRLLKDRILLISDSFVKDRDKNFNELQEMKKTVETLKMENERMKELIMRIGQSVDRSARKEDFMILQRQFNMFRGDK
jgi:predicted  nucleic acid-binding Zn-ribbon protein